MPKGQRGSKAPHGTWARYVGHGCRCDDCRGAATAYQRERRGQTPWAEYVASVAVPHGASAYKRGCRCDVCRAHSAEVKRRYRQAHQEYNERQNKARMQRHNDAA